MIIPMICGRLLIVNVSKGTWKYFVKLESFPKPLRQERQSENGYYDTSNV